MGYVVYASFAIQFYVPMDFLEAPLMDKLGLGEDPGTGKSLSKVKGLLKTAIENTFRGLVVTLLCELLSVHTVIVPRYFMYTDGSAKSSLVGSRWEGPDRHRVFLQNIYVHTYMPTYTHTHQASIKLFMWLTAMLFITGKLIIYVHRRINNN